MSDSAQSTGRARGFPIPGIDWVIFLTGIAVFVLAVAGLATT
ncbi:hypothetical protein [Pseudooceanicola pacificus]|nr:hypothetical protein [Pseudooceanicola pacificus]